MSTADRNTIGADWSRKIADAVGPNIGSPTTRKNFADDVMSKLGSALPSAVRNINRTSSAERLRFAIYDTRRGIAGIESALDELGPIFKKKVRLAGHKFQTKYGLPLGFGNVLGFLNDLERQIKRIPADPDQEKKRGRDNRVPRAIAKMIADQYHFHFKKPPTYKKRQAGDDDLSPFDKVCAVVTELLRSIGHFTASMSIGEAARKDACAKFAKPNQGDNNPRNAPN